MYPQKSSVQQMFEGAWLTRKRVVLRVLAVVFVFDPQKPSVQQMSVIAFEGAWSTHKRVVLRVLALVFVFDPYLAEGLIDSVET